MKKPLVIALGIGVLVMAAALVLGPQRIALSQDYTGDKSVSDQLSELAASGHHNLTAFSIDNNELRFGGLGADADTEIEIGSVTKMLTAELLRHEIDNGNVELETAVGELVPELNAPASELSLQELAEHTSGLPRVGGVSFSDSLGFAVFGSNPYEGINREDIFAAANEVEELEGRGERNYSNLGFALLGHALALNADTTYEDMLNEVVLDPLEMDSTFVATGPVPDDSPQGLLDSGRQAAPWYSEGYAPTGMVRSTARDMAKFAQYLLDEKLPGFGWAETTSERDDNSGAGWHNGATGGYSAMMVVAPETGRASFVSADSTSGVEVIGLRLAGEEV